MLLRKSYLKPAAFTVTDLDCCDSRTICSAIAYSKDGTGRFLQTHPDAGRRWYPPVGIPP
jgi:hypothetical protein